MERTKNTKVNIAVALLHQLVTAVSGLLLPRFILLYYGSEVNGLIQSVSQFLSYTTLLECGIGGLVLASLYKPLADKDDAGISAIFNNTKQFFKKISLVFIAFTLILAMAIKLIVSTEFDFLYTATLVIVLALDVYLSYYYGITHVLLLRADHKIFIVQSTQIITILLNFGISILAITLGGSIHLVKFISAFVFLLNPLAYRWYVKKHYNITIEKADNDIAMPEKKDGIIHHLSYFVHRNTDVVILSVFSNVVTASVYSVYNAVMMVAEKLLLSLSSGIAGAIGNMIAKNEKEELKSTFSLYEVFNTFMTMAFSTVAAILIVPFVRIYTSGVSDADYIQPIFAYLLIGATVMYCIRIPYGLVVNSAGHYKQTRIGAILETVINITVSLAFVHRFGLSGVALGTFLAMTYRTIYTVEYLARNILERPSWLFYKSLIVNLVLAVVTVSVFEKYVQIQIENIWQFLLAGVVVSLAVFPAFAILNLLFSKTAKQRIMEKVKKHG